MNASSNFRAPASDGLAWRYLRTGVAYVLISFGAILTALPFLWMLLSSFKGNADIAAIPLRWLPTEWRPQNYAVIWEMMPFARYYLNSIIVAVAQTGGVLLTASLAAYSFARIPFTGRNVAFFLYLGTIMIPGWVTLIPVFTIVKNLGWLNTYQGLIVPGLTSAMGTFLLRQFFLTIPQDLEDAGFVDGANRLQVYARIMLPLAKPALLTVGLITFKRRNADSAAGAGATGSFGRLGAHRVGTYDGGYAAVHSARHAHLRIPTAILHPGHCAHRPEVS